MQAKQGWECPRCRQINSPLVAFCDCRPPDDEEPMVEREKGVAIAEYAVPPPGSIQGIVFPKGF